MLHLLDLPDEVLIRVATALPLTDLVVFKSIGNKRILNLLSESAVLSTLVNVRRIPHPHKESITTLPRLHLYETVKDLGLFSENRAGFDYGTATVLEDDFVPRDGDTTYIQNSEARLDRLREAMRRYPHAFRVVVDAHSGLGAPTLPLAAQMSRARGMNIVQHWFREFAVGTVAQQRQQDSPVSGVVMCAWSLEVAEKVLRSRHPFRENAETGRGWAELRLCLRDEAEDDDNFMLPPRPEFYDGCRPLPLTDEWMDMEVDSDDDDDDYGIFVLHYDLMNDSDDDDIIDPEHRNDSSDDEDIFPE